jgi:pyridoxine 5-phosphate synthase
MTVLSVNVNKIAVLRNSRGGREPDVVAAARACLDAGAHGITVHPRPDARHIRADDVHALAALTREYGVEFNLEGNPFAPPRPGYPGFHALCAGARPAQATLVPDDDGQLTSDHGFDFLRDQAALVPQVAALKALGCRVSVFANAARDPAAEMAAAAASGADRIELYTAGLGINAGHDLSQANLGEFLAGVPAVLEVSIGHALIGEALYAGIAATVRGYLKVLEGR